MSTAWKDEILSVWNEYGESVIRHGYSNCIQLCPVITTNATRFLLFRGLTRFPHYGAVTWKLRRDIPAALFSPRIGRGPTWTIA